MHAKTILAIVWLAFFFTSHYTTHAQESCKLKVNLQLIEEHMSLPAWPVLIHVESNHKNYEASENGFVLLDQLCIGQHKLIIQLAGEKPYSTFITINQDTTFTLKVHHMGQDLSQVLVKEYRHIPTVQAKENLKESDLQKLNIQNLGQALQQVEGVQVLSTGATVAKPMIHGMQGNRIAIVNNGVRMEEQQWAAEHAPNIDLFNVANATIIKGAAGVAYGTDAIGGVVLINAAEVRRTPGWNGSVRMAAMSNNKLGATATELNYGSKQIPGLGFRVQTSVKKAGNYRVPDHYVANSGMEEASGQAVLVYRRAHFTSELMYSKFTTTLGIYQGSHIGNEDDLNRAIQSDTPMVYAPFTYKIGRPRQNVHHDIAKASFRADSKLGAFYGQYSYQRNKRKEYDVVRTATDNPQLQLTLNTHAAQLKLEHRPIQNWKGNMGIDASVQINEMGNGNRMFIPNYYSLNASVFNMEYHKWNKWLLELGWRYDYRYLDVYNPEGSQQQVMRYQYHFQNLSSIAGVQFIPQEKWKVGLNLSRAWRAPQANELFSNGFHLEAARMEIGNHQLKAEKSWSANLFLEATPLNKVQVNVNAYRQFLQDFIYLEPGSEVLTIRGYYKRFFYKQTDATFTGIDMRLLYEINQHFEAQVKASFLDAKNVISNDYLILMPANRVQGSMAYKKGKLSKNIEWGFECIVKHVGQQKNIPSNFNEIDNPHPPKSYTILDAVFTAGYHFKNKNQINIICSGSNLANKNYRDYLDAFRYFLPQAGRNFIINIQYQF